jgi:hypothetical protein
MGRGLALLLAAVALLLALGGCSGEEGTATTAPGREATAIPPSTREERAPDSVTPSRCPSGLPSCRTTEGRIVYVERVDPDGDGDAHFVIADPQGITLRGLTAIDVRKGLRPQPLPGIGELISAP